MKMTPTRSLILACLTALGFAGSVDARDFAFAPANTKFVLNGKVSFGSSVCLAQWVIRTGAPGSGRARVTLANQLPSKRCTDLTNTAPWSIAAAGPRAYLILKMVLGGDQACGPGDARVSLVNGASHFNADFGSCIVRGSFDSTPKLTIVPQ
jgi:hypothetical protein